MLNGIHFKENTIINFGLPCEEWRPFFTSLKKLKQTTMKFGDIIIIDHKLIRVTDYNIGQNDKKRWKKVSFKTKTEAILIGKRTLSEGYREYHGEIGFIYCPTKYFKVLLVATDINKNPFYVSIDL